MHAIITRIRELMSGLLAPRRSDGDAWARYPARVPITALGAGSQHDFGWYFEGESSIPVLSVGEIQDWLLGCEYVHDRALFNEADFWQHPNTFERLRRGDCEDHALWAWRKLVELGIDADLVSGTVAGPDGDAGQRRGHVWILARLNGEPFVFETVAKVKDRMLLPLAAVRGDYRPEFGVDGLKRRYAFNGALIGFRERRGRRAPPSVRQGA